jgi:dipeptidyl aminopeptidase/acylaminoacyl peptidase
MFRISGGYGKEFLRAGFKQIRRKLMEDVEDGVKYSIEQGWADKDKMAIYGASHGGYATLMGLVKNNRFIYLWFKLCRRFQYFYII